MSIMLFPEFNFKFDGHFEVGGVSARISRAGGSVPRPTGSGDLFATRAVEGDCEQIHAGQVTDNAAGQSVTPKMLSESDPIAFARNMVALPRPLRLRGRWSPTERRVVSGSYRRASARWFPCAPSQGYEGIAVRPPLHSHFGDAQC